MSAASRLLPPEFDRYLSDVRRHCLRVSRDKHLAEDAVQDVFLIAVRRAHTVRDPEHWRGWLFRVARRRLADLYRDRRRRSAVELPAGLEAPAEEDEEDSCRRTQSILRAIRRLPGPVRVAVRMRYLKGDSLKDIATQLETTIDAVKSSLYRARRLLRRQGLR